jgi:hypothetical protein
MAVTSWKDCGTVVNDNSQGTLVWVIYTGTSLGNSALSGSELTSNDGTVGADGNAAGFTFGSNATSQWLKCRNFGFTTSDVPSGSTIDGIEVEFRRARSGGVAFAQTNIKFVISNTVSGNDITSATDWDTTETAVVYGNSTEKGGNTITDTTVTDTNFGVALQVVCGSSRTSPTSHIAFVDQARLRIYYTESGGGGAGKPSHLQTRVDIPPITTQMRHWNS